MGLGRGEGNVTGRIFTLVPDPQLQPYPEDALTLAAGFAPTLQHSRSFLLLLGSSSSISAARLENGKDASSWVRFLERSGISASWDGRTKVHKEKMQ